MLRFIVTFISSLHCFSMNELTQHAAYLRSVDEVREWLRGCNHKSKIFLLVQNGYDDLESLSRCNQREVMEFAEIFEDHTIRKELTLHLQRLRRMGIEEYRAKSEGPVANAKHKTIVDDSKSEPTPEIVDMRHETGIGKTAVTGGLGKGIGDTTSATPTPNHAFVKNIPDLLQAKLGLHCPDLYGEDWVERYFVLQEDTLWCFPSATVCINVAVMAMAMAMASVCLCCENHGQELKLSMHCLRIKCPSFPSTSPTQRLELCTNRRQNSLLRRRVNRGSCWSLGDPIFLNRG